MSAPRPKKPKPPNLVAELRRDAVKGKVPNQPRLMYRGTLNALLDKCDWSTGRNVFISKASIGKGWTGADEQKIGRDLKYLREGGWISEQIGPDPDDPTTMVPMPDAHAREAYEAIRADRRPKIYRVNFLVFYVTPRSITGYQNDSPSADTTGYQNDTPKGYQNDGHGVSLEPPNPPISSNPSDSRLTDSSKNEESSQETNPPREGGLGLSDLDSRVSPAPATQEELRRTVRAALKILGKPLAIMSTEVSWIMTAALKTITTRWRCCLECALLVPYWVENGSTRTGEILQGMNQRTNLTYLWGPAWGNLMGCATQDARADGGGDGYLSRAAFEEEIADLDLYDDARPIEDYPLIDEACRWCPTKRKVARVHPSPGTDPA